MAEGGAASSEQATVPPMPQPVIAEGFRQAFVCEGTHSDAFLAALSALAMRGDKPWANVQQVACAAAQHRMLNRGACGLPPVYHPVQASSSEVQDLIAAFVDMFIESQVFSCSRPPTLFVVPSGDAVH